MIDLAFSTNAFKTNTLAEAVNSIADIGYRALEVMADVPHAFPARFDGKMRQLLKQQIADRGLVVSNVNAFTHFADGGDTYHPTWIEEEPRLRETRIRHTIGSVELAAELSTKTVSLQPGGPLIGTTLSRKAAAERFAEGLQRVLPIAKQHQIILAIEPEPGLFIESSAEYLEFKTRYFAEEPLIRMNCDIGHLFCVGEDPAAVIRTLGIQHIAHVHLEDIGKNRVHQHLTPGKGVIDFASVFAALRAVNYAGPATVELYPYETTAAGVAKMAWERLSPMLG